MILKKQINIPILYDVNHIRILAPERIREARVYDLKGRLLASKIVNAESTDIEKRDLIRGVYIVKLGFEGRNEVCKILIR